MVKMICYDTESGDLISKDIDELLDSLEILYGQKDGDLIIVDGSITGGGNES